jgi:hypothetical protein
MCFLVVKLVWELKNLKQDFFKPNFGVEPAWHPWGILVPPDAPWGNLAPLQALYCSWKALIAGVGCPVLFNFTMWGAGFLHSVQF